MSRVASFPGTVERRTFRVINARGEWRWIEETLANCTDVASVQGLVANIRDGTNEVEARAALTASERRHHTIVETAQEGVLVLQLGPVMPPEVIAAAQAIGLAERLDRCVLQRACADMADLRDRGAATDIKLAVNLGARSVEGSLPQMVCDASQLAGWPLAQLSIELT